MIRYDPLWIRYGSVMDPLWIRYGSVMIRYGSAMIRYGSVMDPLWIRYGSVMDPLCFKIRYDPLWIRCQSVMLQNPLCFKSQQSQKSDDGLTPKAKQVKNPVRA